MGNDWKKGTYRFWDFSESLDLCKPPLFISVWFALDSLQYCPILQIEQLLHYHYALHINSKWTFNIDFCRKGVDNLTVILFSWLSFALETFLNPNSKELQYINNIGEKKKTCPPILIRPPLYLIRPPETPEKRG